MPDPTTNVIVRAKPEGFAKLRDEAGRLNAEVRKGTRGQAEGVREASRELDQFKKSAEAALKTFMASKAPDSIKAITDKMKDLTKEVNRLKRALSEASQARGAFVQGLAQGVGAAEFLQRGPGMGRQIAGRYAGRAIRGAVGVGRGAFGGVSGLTQGIAALPIVGAAAGPMAAAMGYAGQALDFQQQQRAMLPFVGGAGMMQRAQAIRAGAISPAQIARRAGAAREDIRPVEREDVQAAILRAQESQSLLPATTMDALKARVEARRKGIDPGATPGQIADKLREGRRDTAESDMRTQLKNQRQKTIDSSREERREIMQQINKTGRRFGYGAQETAQITDQLQQAAGGLDPQRGGMLSTAMAAKRVYRIDTGVTGAFGRRAGAIRGGGGVGQDITDALRTAVTLGLKGSEINDFMAQMAQGIQNFERTGIPIKIESVQAIGSVFKAGGFKGGRLTAITGQVTAGIQQIGAQGPRSGLEMLAATRLGGFKGGGMDDMVQAMQNMENLDKIDPEKFAGFIRTLSKIGGSGKVGRLTVREGLRGIGANITLSDAENIIEQAQSGKLTPESFKQITASQPKEAGELGTPKQLQALAEGMKGMFPALEKQREIQDQQLDVGRRTLTAVQKLEGSAVEMADAFEKVAGPAVKELATVVENLAEVLNKAAGAKGGWLSGIFGEESTTTK